VHVQSFPVTTGRRDVSPGLGADPLWSPDGGRLYYRSGGRVMRVDVETEPDFRTTSVLSSYSTGRNTLPIRTPVKMDAGSGSGREVWLVSNWFDELRERMGENLCPTQSLASKQASKAATGSSASSVMAGWRGSTLPATRSTTATSR
jgi:hypothetical protein